MGTAVATPFANLYLHFKYRETIKSVSKHFAYSRRYVDDGSMVVRNEAVIPQIITTLNNASDLRITLEGQGSSVTYLDMTVSKGTRFQQEQRLDIQVYTKPISKFLYLHGKSSHPEHVFKGLIHGELVRFLRNTNSEQVWLQKVRFLFSKLAERIYTTKWLRKEFKKVKYSDRIA